jgi:hypothetical protein
MLWLPLAQQQLQQVRIRAFVRGSVNSARAESVRDDGAQKKEVASTPTTLPSARRELRRGPRRS